jgi:hypothetical protein
VDTKLNAYRIRTGKFGTNAQDGMNGAFNVPVFGRTAQCIVSDGVHPVHKAPEGMAKWEHVSLTIKVGKKRTRIPNWNEMCFIKNMFWEPHETVVQFHPPESDYVNIHDHVLHLWRPLDYDIKLPPQLFV